MSETLIGVGGIAALFLCLVARMPVGMALLVVGFGGIWVIGGLRAAIATMSSETYSSVTGYSLSIIPLFVLMGNMAGAARYSQRLYEAANAWIGRLRGGLASATVLGCAAFAAVSGSSVATAGDDRQGCTSADEALRICRRSCHGVCCGRWHPRHPHPAFNGIRSLCCPDRGEYRKTVHRRNSARHSSVPALHSRHLRHHNAETLRRTGGAGGHDR